MAVTYQRVSRGDPFWIGTKHVYANGLKLRSFTPETPEAEVERFVALAQPHCEELAKLAAECEERRQWNHDHPGQGKMWPCFGKLERLWNSIQKQAGIKDT